MHQQQSLQNLKDFETLTLIPTFASGFFLLKMKYIEPRLSDIAICMAMIKDFYSIDNYPFEEVKVKRCFEEILRNKELGRFWMLSDEDKIIGYLILCFGYSFEYGGKDAFIDEFYLIPEARGKGLGTQALKSLRVHAKKLNVKAIHLEVENTNKIGNKLYKKLGFKGNDRSLLTQLIR